jgi:hypothetical protein
MPEIGTSGSMSGDGKRSAAAWPKLPRPSSTLPFLPFAALHHHGSCWRDCVAKLLAALRTRNYRIQMNGVFESTLRASACP